MYNFTPPSRSSKLKYLWLCLKGSTNDWYSPYIQAPNVARGFGIIGYDYFGIRTPCIWSLPSSKSPTSRFTILTQPGSNSNPSTSTSLKTLHVTSTAIKTIASKAVITCVNSTIKNALIDFLINRPLVSVNGSIRIDPTFVNHTMSDIMGCINKVENWLTSKWRCWRELNRLCANM